RLQPGAPDRRPGARGILHRVGVVDLDDKLPVLQERLPPLISFELPFAHRRRRKVVGKDDVLRAGWPLQRLLLGLRATAGEHEKQQRARPPFHGAITLTLSKAISSAPVSNVLAARPMSPVTK